MNKTCLYLLIFCTYLLNMSMVWANQNPTASQISTNCSKWTKNLNCTMTNQQLVDNAVDQLSTGSGGGGVWGNITGNINNQIDLQTEFNAKQNIITLGSTLQYLRGDLSLATFPTNLNQFTNGPGYITGNQNITINGDISGSGSTTITATLPTVNSNVGTFQGITVNAKGLVTQASNQNYLTTNQPITLDGILSGMGTTSIIASAASGYYMPTTSDQSAWNGKQANLSLTAGTYTDHGWCTYLSGVLSCNSTPSGSGTVTNVSVVPANGISGTVANATSTPAITLTPYLYMTGMNWDDAWNLHTTVNWGNSNLVAKSTSTDGAGVGLIQIWNAAKTFFFNMSVNSGISASYGINWPMVAALVKQFPVTGDALGDFNWESLDQLPKDINWAVFSGSGYQTGYVWTATTNGAATWQPSSGGGSVSSVSNSDGSITVSPTTGSVVVSAATATKNSIFMEIMNSQGGMQ
jgi:hypothetical protein